MARAVTALVIGRKFPVGVRPPVYLNLNDIPISHLSSLNLVRIAGETIEGSVDLDLPRIHKDRIKDVKVKMQGAVKTYISGSNGLSSVAYQQVLPVRPAFVSLPLSLPDVLTLTSYSSPFTQSLWSSSNSSESTDVVSYPFRFTIPEKLPPSFYYSNSATRVFLVLPAATESQLQQVKTMRQGWPGPWKQMSAEDKIRRVIPPRPSVAPISVPIPYTLTVTTETRTLDHSDHPEDKHGKPVFPAPPTKLSELWFSLRRKMKYTAGAFKNAQRRGSFDLRQIAAPDLIRRVDPAASYRRQVAESEWSSEDGMKKGVLAPVCSFHILYGAAICANDLELGILGVTRFQIVIPFPGMGNDVKLETPIQLNPSAGIGDRRQCWTFRPADEPQAITLNFKNLVRVAGETIEGTVDLNLPLMRKDGIEELRLEMQGIVKTRIYRTYGQVTVVHKQVLPLFEPSIQPCGRLPTHPNPTTSLHIPFGSPSPDNLP
ncbi:hypothetical protein R3P38DRAFT_3277814, partial [Favolaschia claudopus]